ncbi:MAG: ATP-dependent DNA helicase RecG, partial [Daejeonella sp.]
RGAEQSFCILMSGNKLSHDAKTRLNTMVRTTDGFEISEIDLQLRGPGNLEGTQQSGVLDLKLANLANDQQILQQARQTVIEIFRKDQELQDEKNKRLREYFKRKTAGISWDKIS